MISLIADYLGARDHGESGEAIDERASNDRPLTEAPAHALTGSDLVPAIVEQLERGAVSDEQLGLLRKHLGRNSTPSLEVKLDHLRYRVADLEAYSHALESFIDGEGTVERLLDDLRIEIGATDVAVEALSAKVATMENQQAMIRDDLTTREESLSSLVEHVETLEGRHSREIIGVDAKIDAVEASVESVQADVDRIDERLTDVEALESEIRELRQLETVVSRLDTELTSQNASMATLTDEIAAVKEQAADFESFRDKFVRAVTE